MGATTTDVTVENFEQVVLQEEGIVLIDWWAPWCGPCKSFGPIYEKVAQRNPDITFAKVNTEDQPGLGGQFNIQAIPTLMVFRDRIMVFSQAGMLPEKILNDLIGQVRALDMEEVRREIAEQDMKEEQDGPSPN